MSQDENTPNQNQLNTDQPGDQGPSDKQQPSDKPTGTPDDGGLDDAEKQRRAEQSARDKARTKDGKSDSERLDELENEAAYRAASDQATDFLSKNKEKFPSVTHEQLMQFVHNFDFDFEKTAKYFQDLSSKAQQEALAAASVPQAPERLSDAEADEANKKLEENVKKTGKSGFLDFLNIERRRQGTGA